jgi:hypothetical protein
VPVWHEQTKELQDSGELAMIGIVSEQHPDRARLFMQWKRMDWPILVDSLNLLDVTAVPITVLIDEAGVVRATGVRRTEQLEEFLALPAPEEPAEPVEAAAPDLASLRRAAADGDAAANVALADALVMWGEPSDLTEAIESYLRTVAPDSEDGRVFFRIGVAQRRRFESDHRQPDDFADAVIAWQAALELDPNQYIWRRRIQQYGPRLDKPYSFYDWVHEARREIEARGEQSAPLAVEPSGAEFASPQKEFAPGVAAQEPDPQRRIDIDDGEFIEVRAVATPGTGGQRAVRAHVSLAPRADRRAHWNNEADPLAVWMHVPEGWSADQRLATGANPPSAVSDELRSVEFELSWPEGAERGARTLRGYALYNVCEDVDGVCLYRRQDFEVPVVVR